MRQTLYERYYGSKYNFLIISENLKINKISIDQKRPSWPGKNGEIGDNGEFLEVLDSFRTEQLDSKFRSTFFIAYPDFFFILRTVIAIEKRISP